jgi:predicted metal-dependent peptidase
VPGRSDRWERDFAEGLQAAAAAAVSVTGGQREKLDGPSNPPKTPWRAALDWFVTSYPLLGGIAAGVRLVESADRCRAGQIRVAAVDPGRREIVVNPHVTLTGPERRFVIAHEILHAALRHDTRLDDRDPWLWNIATDYVINGWLVKMALGRLPDGGLHDPQLTGWSAEEVYDRLSTDLRRLAKLATFAGVGVCDVLTGDSDTPNVDLDEFYRRAIANGFHHHSSSGRGLLPAGLAEEIQDGHLGARYHAFLHA